tara:strand:- start:1506 stop:1757 length:252 start_codon:yes stop_codon:yes gene_type:complete
MSGYKTIISANIPVQLADRLKNKTKGTRSRVIERALKNYLDAKESFTIEEISTEDILLELMYRQDLPKSQRQILNSMWLEMKE